jgi:uncharacterized repeat protein (TIGR03803 family)
MTMAILAMASGAWAQIKFKTLYKFSGPAETGPLGGLTFDAAGNLYGTTAGGGNGGGTVFRLKHRADGGWTESVLYNFCSLAKCSDGTSPHAGVIFDHAGNLYGTTEFGGQTASGGWGTVFTLAHNADGTWTESVIYNFCSVGEDCSDGRFPLASLVFDAAGNLFGTTSGGGGVLGWGVVFKLTRNSKGGWSESVIHQFSDDNGQFPYAGLIFDQAGNLYGTTEMGGGGGDVFKLTPSSNGKWTESVIYTFLGRGVGDGSLPYAGVIFDQAGNLYGTTYEGGKYGCGSVFQLVPNSGGSWTESVLHSFSCKGAAGTFPKAGLAVDQAGSLYGTTFYGGNLSICNNVGCGVVFKLAPNSTGGWSETVLHYFNGVAGALPASDMVFDAAGNLYGTSSGDGGSTVGSVFEITP